MASFLFFNGGEVVTYDHGVDQVVIRQDIATRFPGSQGQDFHHNIDAALNIENGFLYLFKGSDYMRFDLARDKFDLLRVPIGRGWRPFSRRPQWSVRRSSPCSGAATTASSHP